MATRSPKIGRSRAVKDIAKVIPLLLISHWPSILCILLISILMTIDAGQDMLVGIMDVDKPIQIYQRTGMIFLGLSIYCSSIWFRPVIQAASIFSGTVFLRYLAIAPCFVLGAAIQVAQIDQGFLDAPSIYWALTFLMMLFLASIFFRERIYTYVGIPQTIVLFGLSIFLLITGIFINKIHGEEQQILNYHLFGIAIAVLGVGLFHLFMKIDHELRLNASWDSTSLSYRIYYYSTVLLIAFFVLLFSFSDHINLFHPLFVFLICFSFYTIIFNSINALHDKIKPIKTHLKNVLIVMTFAAIFWALYFPNYEHHRVQLVEQSEAIDRMSIDEHMEYWLESKVRPWLEKHPGQDFPLFLVCGEGGGSRAGYWFSKSILSIDSINNYRFKDHLYAFSTVSGSSVGAGSVLSFWEYNQGADLGTKKIRQRNFSEGIFSNNFLSSSVYSILIRDFLKQIFPIHSMTSNGDRNYWLQGEEAFFIDQNLRKNKLGLVDYLSKPKFPHRSDTSVHMFRPYLSYYYESNGDIKDNPLFFSNSTSVNTGNRAIISPVSFDEEDFIDAIDLVGNLNRSNPCQGLSLGEACNLSELFPYFSATAVLDDSISLGDGGYFENLGITLISELRELLKAKLNLKKYRDINSRIDIQVIAIRNSTYKLKRERALSVKNQFFSPLEAVYNAGIGGRTEYMFKSMMYEMGEDFHVIDLDHQDPNEKLLLPLSRYLSKKSVQTMNKLWHEEDISVFEIE